MVCGMAWHRVRSEPCGIQCSDGQSIHTGTCCSSGHVLKQGVIGSQCIGGEVHAVCNPGAHDPHRYGPWGIQPPTANKLDSLI